MELFLAVMHILRKIGMELTLAVIIALVATLNLLFIVWICNEMRI